MSDILSMRGRPIQRSRCGRDLEKLILQQEKPQVVASVMEYLTDRLYGRPTQTDQGNPEQPVTIQLQWAVMPESLPSVTVNQQVNNITSTDRAEEIRQLIEGQPRRLE